MGLQLTYCAFIGSDNGTGDVLKPQAVLCSPVQSSCVIVPWPGRLPLEPVQ